MSQTIFYIVNQKGKESKGKHKRKTQTKRNKKTRKTKQSKRRKMQTYKSCRLRKRKVQFEYVYDKQKPVKEKDMCF